MLFGSGESSPTGRKIHEYVLKRIGKTVRPNIGILETPTGFEVNSIHGWPERLENFFREKLQNFKPQIHRIRAWRKDGEHSTNDPRVVDPIKFQDYVYCGAGSPGYTVKHLKNSLAYRYLKHAFRLGTTLCLGSASAIAMGAFALPVYEIFKTGQDIHWMKGLNLFGSWGMPLAIIPHWNNQEGEDFDTTRCYMGQTRFLALEKLLPPAVTVLGIDEQTACIIDVRKRRLQVLGVGRIHIRKHGKKETVIASGDSCDLSVLI